MDTSKIVVGQLVIRDSGETKPDGRRLVSFIGIMAIPPDVMAQLETEHQYVFFQKRRTLIEQMSGLPDEPGVRLVWLIENGVDVSKISRGDDLGALITEAIWRV